MGYTIHVEKDALGNITETPYGSTSNEASMVLMNDNTSVQAKVMSLVSQIATLQGQVANTLEAPASAAQNQVLAFNGTDWDATYVVEADNCNQWNAYTTYAVGDTCICDGKDWKSKINNNIGNRPAEGNNWEQLTLSSLSTNKADKATTLAGYGITNAYTKTETDNLISPITTKLSDNADWLKSVNLFNYRSIVPYAYNAQDGSINSTTGENVQHCDIEIKPNTKYTISGQTAFSSSWLANVWFDSSHKFISVANIKNVVGTCTVESPSNAKYLGLSVGVYGGNENDERYTLQIEEGETATDYQEYSKSNKQITNELADFSGWKYHKKTITQSVSSTTTIDLEIYLNDTRFVQLFSNTDSVLVGMEESNGHLYARCYLIGTAQPNFQLTCIYYSKS